MRRTEIVTSIVILALAIPCATSSAQSSAVGHTLPVNGFEMYYETRGEGAPLLLVHGWGGNAEYFAPLLDQLSNQYELIVPELRGHGHSTNPDGTFTIGETSSDVLALLDHLGLEKVRALGASAGGLTLLQMAIDDPDAIEAMIVVGVGTHFPAACKESMAATDPDELSSEWWDVMRDRHPRGDSQIREIAGYLRNFATVEGEFDFTTEELASIKAHTLIVQGDSDWCFPTPLVAAMHRAIPNASLWVIPNGEHVPILGRRAAAFLNLALAFYRGDPLQ